MWHSSGGQQSPPTFPSILQNSRTRQSQILGPLDLVQTDVRGSSAIYRCTCKCEEEPIPYKYPDYNESVKIIETEVSTFHESSEVEVVMTIKGGGKPRVGYPSGAPIMPRPTAVALQVASKLIKHARDIRYPNEHCLWCPDCRLFPMLPVTGPCGHTRCTMCIEQNGACPCGTQPPATLHLNILIQDLITKMLSSKTSRTVTCSAVSTIPENLPEPSTSTGGCQELLQGPTRTRRQARQLHQTCAPVVATMAGPGRQPVSPQARYNYARDMLKLGRLREAAPHLAHAAVSSEPVARSARFLLAQTVTVLSKARDPRRITRELYRLVREESATVWLKASDLECVICYQVLQRPVTTPCGHTFCRACLERILDYRKRCALCLRSLNNFSVILTEDTSFVCAALSAIDAPIVASPFESEFIPIFACTVAYPTIPCPLLIFDPRYWVMIRRVLESGSRKFGMVAYERNRAYSDYGTILEVRDCVQFEDGRSILSTVGVTRFKVIERAVRDGCQMARIQELTDIVPTADLLIWELQLLAQQISYKALLWLSSLDRTLVSDIEAAFGQIPQFQHEEVWWENPNGPEWLWWLIAILPLRSEIQVLMLSTKHLMKRMTAVSRTLEVMDHIAISPVLSRCDLESEIYLVYQNRTRR